MRFLSDYRRNLREIYREPGNIATAEKKEAAAAAIRRETCRGSRAACTGYRAHDKSR